MKKLIEGIIDFRKSLDQETKGTFAKLALEQNPDALFIGCCDSRVVANVFASTDPGDLFVLRNIGNLIPPASSHHDTSAPAAMEFSVLSLNISDIIVCGHSECGAMRALCDGTEKLSCAHLKSWLEHGKKSLEKVRGGTTLDDSLSEHNQVSQMNVLTQIEHLKSYPFIQERLASGQLQIHGMWFDIAPVDVYYYEESLNRFVIIDEKQGKLILDRLKT